MARTRHGCERCELGYPALARLCRVYLHADWPDEYADEQRAVDAFVTDEPALAARLPGEVGLVLERMPLEGAVMEVLVMHLGCAFWPYAGGVGYRQWLESLAARVVGRPPA